MNTPEIINKPSQMEKDLVSHLPELRTLERVMKPVDLAHRNWSPLQKLSQIHAAMQLAEIFGQPDFLLRAAEEQAGMLEQVFVQLREEQRNAHKPTLQVLTLFALECDQVANKTSATTAGKLYVLAEAVVSSAVGSELASLHAPMHLLAARMALKAAVLAHQDDIVKVMPDPDNKLVLNELKAAQADPTSDPELITRLQRTAAMTPAERKFLPRNGVKSGDPKTGYLASATSYLDGAVTLLHNAEHGDATVVSLDSTQKKEAEELRAQITRITENKLTGSDFEIAAKVVAYSGATEDQVTQLCNRMDASTLQDFDYKRLEAMQQSLKEIPTARPIVDKISVAMIHRLLFVLSTDTQKLGDADRELFRSANQQLQFLLDDMRDNAAPKVAAQMLLEVAKYELSRATTSSNKEVVRGRWTRIFGGKSAHEDGATGLALVKQLLEQLLEKFSEIQNDEHLDLDNGLVAIYLEYARQMSQSDPGQEIEVLNAVYDQLSSLGLNDQAFARITHRLSQLQDVSAPKAADRSEAIKQVKIDEIAKLEQVIAAENAPKNLQTEARLNLALAYNDLGTAPQRIVEVLYCAPAFDLRTYSQEVTRRHSADKTDSAHDTSALERKLFTLRVILANSLLRSLEIEFSKKKTLEPDEIEKIRVWTDEATRLHPQIIDTANIIAKNLLHRKDSKS